MSQNYARVGDRVDISFANRPQLIGDIRHVPKEVGDTWVIFDGCNIVHVGMFETMRVHAVREGQAEKESRQ